MTTKHKENKAVVLTASELRAVKIADLIKSGDTIGESMNAVCQAERKARKNKPLGTVRSADAFMVRLNERLVELGYTGSTLANKLTAVRIAVNEGKPFAHKPYAQPAKKGAKPSKANETKPTVKLVIVKDATPKQVADGLRQAVNDKAFRESYSALAAFIVDALDEFDGE
jgi:hypothetical protein